VRYPLAVETSGLVYDYSTNRVGIGTASPGSTLSFGANVQETIRLYDSGAAASSYGLGIASDDLQIFTSSGKKISLMFPCLCEKTAGL
jgi:hypothetical protein